MTEKKAIKGLECCVKNDCTDCPYREANDGYSCITELMEDVFELHKSQQAEIERLEGTVEMYEEERKYHFEMSRQKIAEAIKEFADELRFRLSIGTWKHKNVLLDDCKWIIDNLVKEMVGEDK